MGIRHQGKYFIVRKPGQIINDLIALAEGAGVAVAAIHFKGPPSRVRAKDPAMVAKTLNEFAKANPALVVTFGSRWTCQWKLSTARYGAEWKTML